MRISHLTVADSDDRPDVSTREANSHELNAMPTRIWRGREGRDKTTLVGSGVKGRQESSVPV